MCVCACSPHRELAEESGIKNWGRVPALNTNAIFIDDLADAVLEALPYVGKLAKPNDSLVPIGECVLCYVVPAQEKSDCVRGLCNDWGYLYTC